MGCVPSKLFRKDVKQEEIVFGKGTNSTHRHVASLTSSTYGVLNLEKKQPIIVKDEFWGDFKRKKSPIREEPTMEVINAWELMEGLKEEEAPPVSIRRSPKPMVFLRGFGDLDTKRSPLKFLNQMATSPKKLMRFGGGGGGGKENNRGLVNRFK
ncbi:hypothetical protein Vadar_034765 [Vaccinium darrowii]|uniref:Uncharacterized protein n=1 Tax=Vaccinium darrowii TaxID=229202 RepID=A0ACB7XEP6_9ERIC|nr:hypothetical protein Vadar_034765 [Vaccinium darrowii]